MDFLSTPFRGLVEIEPLIYTDVRGIFFESYNELSFKEEGIPNYFPLEFQSISKRGVLRGMHFQKEPYAQGKLIRVIRGKVLDVVIDLRKKEKTYGKWHSTILSEENKKMLWIPIGFAHGFLTLENETIMTYKLTAPYSKSSEGGIIWNDPVVNIDWKIKESGISGILLSDKDKLHPLLSEAYAF